MALLIEDLERTISEIAGTPARVSGLRMLPGGASQEAWALDVEFAGGPAAGVHALVLRRDMGGALSGAVLPRDREYAVLQVVHAVGVPTPRPYWYIPPGTLDGNARAAFLMERLSGETIGRRIVQDPALAEARLRLPDQAAHALAILHGIDPAQQELSFLRAPQPGQTAAQAAIAMVERDLAAIEEPHPALELGLRWLRAHDPGLGELVLLHGDYRVGNFMVGPEGLRGILDWENAHIGDPHEDLAWMCVRAWRFGHDTLPVGGIGEREPFYHAYTRASGRAVSAETAYYWEVMGNMRWAVGALGQARRHLAGLERSIELASLGRIAAEMELEVLRLTESPGVRRAR